MCYDVFVLILALIWFCFFLLVIFDGLAFWHFFSSLYKSGLFSRNSFLALRILVSNCCSGKQITWFNARCQFAWDATKLYITFEWMFDAQFDVISLFWGLINVLSSLSILHRMVLYLDIIETPYKLHSQLEKKQMFNLTSVELSNGMLYKKNM